MLVQVTAEVGEALSDVSSIIFFLIGAMTIVEVVDAHQVSGCQSVQRVLDWSKGSSTSNQPSRVLRCVNSVA
jgi:hypothetical protein